MFDGRKDHDPRADQHQGETDQSAHEPPWRRTRRAVARWNGGIVERGMQLECRSDLGLAHRVHCCDGRGCDNDDEGDMREPIAHGASVSERGTPGMAKCMLSDLALFLTTT
jgi:hypothetical protein